ncbi:hypothetical protein NHF46_00765 [Arthrobacter alpinus]|nr:hypothetical protein [Arthrobacter alpinus]
MAVATWLGTSTETLFSRDRDGLILGCKTADDVWIYPTWQFDAYGDLLPGLEEVLRVLNTGTSDGWTKALWLVTRVIEFDGESAIDWLSENNKIEQVLESAKKDVRAWTA